MIAIVDSGSSKSDWKFIRPDQNISIPTMGFNPLLHSSDLIHQKTKEALAHKIASNQVTDVFYYGAGCWDAKRKSVVENGLRNVFPNAQINVHSDLLAAARATCDTSPGISCIIGTGSNSCLFDGQKIMDNVTSLGYLLGDEGSGTHLGKKIIQAYFYREMPSELNAPFETFLGGKKEVILDNVYQEPSPNVYLASFTRFIIKHISHEFIKKLVASCFQEFISRHLAKYEGSENIPVHFVGSVSFIFQTALKEVLTANNMQAGIFIKQPIENLVKFHTKHLS